MCDITAIEVGARNTTFFFTKGCLFSNSVDKIPTLTLRPEITLLCKPT